MMWYDIPIEGCSYQINTDGHVKNLKGKILRRNIYGSYEGYRLVVNGKVIRVSTHRVLAMIFVPGFRPDLQVNHIDGNKLNNDINNLEWVTASQNIKHAHDNGLAFNPKKLSDEELKRFWKMRKEGLHWRQAMLEFRISKGSVFNYDVLGRGG